MPVTFFPLPLSANAHLMGDTSHVQRSTEAGRPSAEAKCRKMEAGAEGWGSGLLSRRETLSFPRL